MTKKQIPIEEVIEQMKNFISRAEKKLEKRENNKRENKTKYMSLFMEPQLHQWVCDQAEMRCCSRASVLRDLILGQMNGKYIPNPELKAEWIKD